MKTTQIKSAKFKDNGIVWELVELMQIFGDLGLDPKSRRWCRNESILPTSVSFPLYSQFKFPGVRFDLT